MTRMIVGTVILLLGARLAAGQSYFADSQDISSHSKIERLLDQEQDMLFEDTTLSTFVSFLNSRGIPTYLDERSLDVVGMSADTRITMREHSIRLRDGIALALRPLELAYTFHNGRLLITTPEEENKLLLTRFYDVRNLVELVPVPGGFDGTSSTVAYAYDFDSLIEIITESIAAESWDEVGGAGTIGPYYTRRMRVIVVSQTYENHRQIQKLLDDLARHGGQAPLPDPVFRATASQPFNPITSQPAAQPIHTTSGIRSSRLRTTGQ